jgi:diacylglycerol kinase (ATP)
MEFEKKQDWLRVFRALGYSLMGLAAAWKNEQAFRQEVGLLLVLLPVIALLPAGLGQKLLLVGLLLGLMVVELLNSAVEAAIDRIGRERHPLSRNAKDMGSAAVLLMMLINALAWVAVLFG